LREKKRGRRKGLNGMINLLPRGGGKKKKKRASGTRQKKKEKKEDWGSEHELPEALGGRKKRNYCTESKSRYKKRERKREYYAIKSE